MSADICDFLTKLATEPETLSSFMRDPDRVIADEGLPEEFREALTSGDAAQIHRMIATDASLEEETKTDSQVASPASPTDIAATDQAVAAWLYNYYYQSYLWWNSANLGAAPQAASPDAAKPDAPQGDSQHDNRDCSENKDESDEKRGSLVAVGTGIRVVGQLTVEAIASMKTCDKLLYCVGDPIAEHVVKSLNADGAESMYHFYAEGKPRAETYEEMIQKTLSCVRSGLNTCVALYGHPGVFAWPAHESIRRARAEGYRAKMLPAVSAEDCLFADVGIDPATAGCQSYEATDFMINSRVVDTSSIIILWQIGVVGDWSFKKTAYDTSSMPLLMERLSQFYPANHNAFVYEAAVYPGCDPVVREIPLFSLPWAGVTAMSTLCIPPARAPVLDANIQGRVAALQQ